MNRRLQEGQGMLGHGGKDRMTNTWEGLNGCGKRDGKGSNGPKKGEGTSWSKLKRMGIMGKWIEVGAHLGIGEKLIAGTPSGACWDGWDSWDVQWHFEDK